MKGDKIYDIKVEDGENGGREQMDIRVVPTEEGEKRLLVETQKMQVEITQTDVEVTRFEDRWGNVLLLVNKDGVYFKFFDPDAGEWVSIPVTLEDALLLAELRRFPAPGADRIRKTLGEVLTD